MSLRDRLAIVTLGAARVAMDLRSGRFFELNASAARIVEALAAGASPDEAARALAAVSGIETGAAAAAVRDVLAALDAPAAAPRGPLVFEEGPAGLVAVLDARRVARISPSGDAIARLDEGAAADVPALLRLLVPHALTLGGAVVLHAGAVLSGGEVYAYTGPSGAGKTTLVRALGAAGARVLSEDLLLVRASGERPEAVLDGEACVRAFCEQAAPVFARGEAVDTRPLAQAFTGCGAPLAEVAAIDGARRSGDAFSFETLDRVAGLAVLLANSFAEAGTPAVFRHVLESSARLATSVRLTLATVPDGLAALETAATSSGRAAGPPDPDPSRSSPRAGPGDPRAG